MVFGTHDTGMRVLMLNAGDQGYDQGVDAKMVLGADWQEKVKDGINSC
jgi:hypothetical protein